MHETGNRIRIDKSNWHNSLKLCWKSFPCARFYILYRMISMSDQTRKIDSCHWHYRFIWIPLLIFHLFKVIWIIERICIGLAFYTAWFCQNAHWPVSQSFLCARGVRCLYSIHDFPSLSFSNRQTADQFFFLTFFRNWSSYSWFLASNANESFVWKPWIEEKNCTQKM